MLKGGRSVEALRGQQFFKKAIKFAHKRNPSLQDIDRNELADFVREATLEITFFETLAKERPLSVPNKAEEAKRIVAIWDVSGMGTYLKPYQKDRWEGIPWVEWTDRRRSNYSVVLARRLIAQRTGNEYISPKGVELSSEYINSLRSDWERVGPYIIYGSTAEQNEDVKRGLEEPKVIVPESKVHVIDFPGEPGERDAVNTLKQVQAFTFPDELQIKDGDILAIVTHAPHMVRLLHMLGKYRPFPEGLTVQPYPMQSLPFAGTNFATMEISGLMAAVFLTGDATREPHPYYTQL